jgi:hypothetical protein
LEPNYIIDLEQTGTDTGGGDDDELTNHIEPPVVNAWIIQDGPYWRSRAETLRRTADETDTFRPETRARMLRLARDFDVLAARAEATRLGEPR